MGDAMTDMSLAPDLAPMPTTKAASAHGVRPRSAVSSGVGVAGLVGLLGWFGVARFYGMNGEHSALASVFFCGLAMVLWSLVVDKVHRNPSTGIDWDAAPRGWGEARDTSLVKLAGLWATWAIIAGVYGVLRYYWAGQYAFSMKWLGLAVVPLVLASIPYVLWLDRRLVQPRDGAWHFGQWLIGAEGADSEEIWKHWRAWVVKGFFLAFMLSIVPGNFIPLIMRPWDVILGNPVEFALFGIAFLYLIDVHFATVGYILTMKPLDAHIRTANPYGMAWVAALACYPPFVLMNPGGPLFYQEGAAEWHAWLSGQTALLWVWGALLIGLNAVYAWATVAFGIRFSNLTHRGIITHGPYRFTRHPAYVAKNMFWWASSLVILPWDGSIATALRNTALLCAVSGVYYWRAKTEEKHLLADPEYRAYWEWAQEHAFVPKLMTRLTGLARPMIVLESDPRVGPVA
jgi:protein-S-isoprenylcysteine O-methyltransferase Ste14